MKHLQVQNDSELLKVRLKRTISFAFYSVITARINVDVVPYLVSYFIIRAVKFVKFLSRGKIKKKSKIFSGG